VVETYSVKCGELFFVYILNDSNCDVTTDVTLFNLSDNLVKYAMRTYIPEIFNYNDIGNTKIENAQMKVKDIYLRSKDEMILIITPTEKK
jgi:hypothetical protein